MRFLITAGGTREYIDPVRFISNASSGKTGLALAHAALKAGHKVTLISAASLAAPAKARTIYVNTANEMFTQIKKHFNNCDCLIMAAAVADYTPANPAKTKIKKTNKYLTIKLKPTVDILKWAAAHKKKHQKVVGFALEDKNIKTNAEKKLKDKRLDMIIVNTPAAIGSQKTSVHVKTPSGNWISIPHIDKNHLAKRLISLIESSL
jgi:phosphopantothenoylcysteine decarboxylase/phosphopantothenate--cysteine ligase